MPDIAIVAASQALGVVAVLSLVLALIYIVKAVGHVKPDVSIWLDAPFLNPFSHILVTRNLTEAGLKYRRRLLVAVATFFVAWSMMAGLETI